eukprot:515569_1
MGNKSSKNKQNEIHPNCVVFSFNSFIFSMIVLNFYKKTSHSAKNTNNIPQDIINIMFQYYPLIDSVIISQPIQTNVLIEWIKQRNCNNQWSDKHIFSFALLYRASIDGISPQAFQNKCCDKDVYSLVLIETFEGHIIGGFTTNAWKLVRNVAICYGKIAIDKYAFTFLLHCNNDQFNYKPQIYGIKSDECSIETSTSVYEDTGPNFAGSSNLHVMHCENNSNGMDVKIHFPHTIGFQNAQFSIKNYEVFQVN